MRRKSKRAIRLHVRDDAPKLPGKSSASLLIHRGRKRRCPRRSAQKRQPKVVEGAKLHGQPQACGPDIRKTGGCPNHDQLLKAGARAQRLRMVVVVSRHGLWHYGFGRLPHQGEHRLPITEVPLAGRYNTTPTRDTRHFHDRAPWIGNVLQNEQGKSGVKGRIVEWQVMSGRYRKLSTWARCRLPCEGHIFRNRVSTVNPDRATSRQECTAQNSGSAAEHAQNQRRVAPGERSTAP
jgi:hypothetical protein